MKPCIKNERHKFEFERTVTPCILSGPVGKISAVELKGGSGGIPNPTPPLYTGAAIS